MPREAVKVEEKSVKFFTLFYGGEVKVIFTLFLMLRMAYFVQKCKEKKIITI